MRLSKKELEYINGGARPYSLSDSERSYSLNDSNAKEALKLKEEGKTIAEIAELFKMRGVNVTRSYLSDRIYREKLKNDSE